MLNNFGGKNYEAIIASILPIRAISMAITHGNPGAREGKRDVLGARPS